MAIERCVAAGGDKQTIEVVEIDVVPVSYTTNGATNLLVRVIGDLLEVFEDVDDAPSPGLREDIFRKVEVDISTPKAKASSYEITEIVDVESYRPRIDGNTWHLSETDLNFLVDGTGVLGVGSCGEPYPTYLACMLALRNGTDLRIMRHDTIPDDAVILGAGFMVLSPPPYLIALHTDFTLGVSWRLPRTHTRLS